MKTLYCPALLTINTQYWIHSAVCHEGFVTQGQDSLWNTGTLKHVNNVYIKKFCHKVTPSILYIQKAAFTEKPPLPSKSDNFLRIISVLTIKVP